MSAALIARVEANLADGRTRGVDVSPADVRSLVNALKRSTEAVKLLTEWRPIASAAHDGTPVLLKFHSMWSADPVRAVAVWSKEASRWHVGYDPSGGVSPSTQVAPVYEEDVLGWLPIPEVA